MTLALLVVLQLLATGPVAAGPDSGDRVNLAWSEGLFPLAGTSGPVHRLLLREGEGGTEIVLGGSFSAAGAASARGVVIWRDGHFHPLGGGTNGAVYALILHDDGSGPSLFAGGAFTRADDQAAPCVARWDGTRWWPLGRGMDGSTGRMDPRVNALAVFEENGTSDLYAAGHFSSAGDGPAHSIARWDGKQWSCLGEGLRFGAATVDTLAVLATSGVSRLVAGGRFGRAGSAKASSLAAWDSNGWTTIPTPAPLCWIRSLCLHRTPGGERLVLAGDFWSLEAGQRVEAPASVYTLDANGVTPLGERGSSSVERVLSLPSSDGDRLLRLLPGERTTSGVEQWNGRSWEPTRPVLREVEDALATPGGETMVAGSFREISGTPALHVALLAGAEIRSLSSGISAPVHALATTGEGEHRGTWAGVVLAGPSTAPSSRLAKVTASGLLPHGPPLDAEILAIEEVTVGTTSSIYVAGSFTRAGDREASGIARVEGDALVPLAAGLTSPRGRDRILRVCALATYDAGEGSELIAGGNFGRAGGERAFGLAAWNGTAWRSLHAELLPLSRSEVHALAVHDPGDGSSLFVAGHFELVGDLTVNHVARWDGKEWHALGPGLLEAERPVDTVVRGLAVHDDGSGLALYAAGNFTHAGDERVLNLARWRGGKWQPVGTGLAREAGSITCLRSLVLGGRPLLVAGDGGVLARALVRAWDGASWISLGESLRGEEATVHGIVPTADGRGLLVGGSFLFAGDAVSAHLARGELVSQSGSR